MSPVQTVMNNQRKKIIIGLGVVFGGLWLMLVFYLLTGNKQPVTITPGTIAVHAPSPVAIGSTPSATFRGSRKGSLILHHSASAPQWSYVQQAPKASMTSTSMHIHQTSDAAVKTVGGGGGGNGIYATSGGSTGSRGIRYTANVYSGTIYVPTRHNAVTEVGASTANDVATTSSVRAAGPKRAVKDDFPVYPEDHVPDEVETPVGDVAWGLMGLLALAYACIVYNRKKQSTTPAA